jgi:hypothetical protein
VDGPERRKADEENGKVAKESAPGNRPFKLSIDHFLVVRGATPARSRRRSSAQTFD